LLEEISFLLKVQPYQTVSFEAQAARAKCIRAWVNSAIGQKLSVMIFANRALHLVTHIENAKRFETYSAKKLQVFAGDKPNKQRNQCFHWAQR
jgi:hypothetical protein